MHERKLAPSRLTGWRNTFRHSRNSSHRPVRLAIRSSSRVVVSWRLATPREMGGTRRAGAHEASRLDGIDQYFYEINEMSYSFR
jgi:hypothetical protein